MPKRTKKAAPKRREEFGTREFKGPLPDISGPYSAYFNTGPLAVITTTKKPTK